MIRFALLFCLCVTLCCGQTAGPAPGTGSEPITSGTRFEMVAQITVANVQEDAIKQSLGI